jgi:hypothetical protein
LAEQLASHGARLALVGLEPETMAAVAEFDSLQASIDAAAASASERTRELAGL